MPLFLKLHRAVPLLLILGALCAIAPAVRALATRIDAPVPALPELILLPTLMASLIGEAIATPMAELERSAARGQRSALLAYGLAVTLLSAAALGLVFREGDGGHGWLSVARAMAGQAGGAFLSAAVLGGARAFMIPIGIGLGVTTAAGVLGTGGAAAWMLADDGDAAAWAIASSLILIGSIALRLRAPIPR
jgi:hypothetical protein